MNPYESARMVADYLFFHYADFAEAARGLPVPESAWGFPRRVVAGLLDSSTPLQRALDLGCAVGGSSFELSKSATSVVGVDFSRAFIDAALALQKSGSLGAEVALEGARKQAFQARVDAMTHRERVEFRVGDAMSLPEDLGVFEVVLAANLVCRLPDPARFLKEIADRVAPGGQLLLATPFSWLEEFTTPGLWLGGAPASGESFHVMRDLLHPCFELEHTVDIPFLIREHGRKFQYGISLGSRWRRR